MDSKQIENGICNVSQLAVYLGMDLELLIEIITGKKKLMLRELPCIMSLGSLALANKAMVGALDSLIGDDDSKNKICSDLYMACNALQREILSNYSEDKISKIQELMKRE